MNANAHLKALSNDKLLFSTRELTRRSLVVEADLIEHLGEIDERRLYLDNACPSMFAFCMKEYGFSEGAAYNRIGVARAARRFPAVIAALRAGSVHLAGLRVLAPHFTDLNCEPLLQEAKGKSKKEIEELVARIVPADPVQTSIRRVPTDSVGLPAAAQQQGLLASVPAVTPRPESAPTPESSVDRDAAAGDVDSTPMPWPSPLQARPRTVMAPLSGESFEIRFTASRMLRDKLLEAEALLGHRSIRGEAARPSRHIPEAIRRAVYERDGGRCTYTDESGRRCNSTHKLTFDHRSGFARTLVHSADDIAVMCDAHNQHAADKMYGRAFMDRARQRSHRDAAGTARAAEFNRDPPSSSSSDCRISVQA